MVMMMMANIGFVLLKINDIDVGKLRQQQPQEQQKQQESALNLLLSEENENIVLQLKRKSDWSHISARQSEDCSEQGIEVSKKLCYLKIQRCSAESARPIAADTSNDTGQEIIMSLHLPNSEEVTSKSTQTEDLAYYVHEQLRNIQKDTERLIEEEHNLFEQSLAPEIDIEEITLRKTHSNERLGLTVCYSAGEEYGETDGGGGTVSGGSGNDVYAATGTTEVYISDIHADSVAGRDGRLRQGDQILQINGKDITNKEETETLIAENNNAVTLLVSRYLYGEEDFNDPSTNDDDDEVLVVEDDEDDEEEDEEEEEFYDENNMTYVNCMTSKECCLNTVDDFDKAIMSQVVEQQPKLHHSLVLPNEETTTETNTGNLGGGCSKAIGGGGTAKVSSKGDKRTSFTTAKKTASTKLETNTTSALLVSSNNAENKTSDYYESEHIYETIPEDPESEPFYCSPYDSSVYVTAIASCSSSTGTTDALQQQMPNKQRVVQWLGINSTQGPGLHRQSMRASVGNCNRSLKYRHKTNTSSTGRSTMTSLTNGSGIDAIGSAMTLPASAHADDQDNSSSAYNTGGSNNSVSPHSLVLNQKSRTDPAFNQALGSIPLSVTNSADDVLTMQHLLMQHKIVAQQKILSPKDKIKITSPKSNNKLPLMDLQNQLSAGGGGGSSNVPKPAMYTNNEPNNIQRNMLIQQQHLIKQPLTLEKNQAQAQSPYYQPHQMQEQTHCPPQFTAPNLSQYHFVSSQEVNNLSLNNKIPKSSPTIAENAAAANNVNNVADSEDAMVWKVKRRPDGTRYIVRRPAKSRNIKERNSVRLNMERLRDDNTTTEDDNISEVKTGRYWTREERKKHIEKAKERRQQQQQQMQYQQQQQQHQQLIQHQQQRNETSNDFQEREKMRQSANFLSFSRQKYRQHYQLQFNSAEAQKHKQTQNYINTTTMAAATMGCEDNSVAGTAALHNNTMDQNESHAAVTTATTTSSTHLTTNVEHNNMSSSTMISVTNV